MKKKSPLFPVCRSKLLLQQLLLEDQQLRVVYRNLLRPE